MSLGKGEGRNVDWSLPAVDIRQALQLQAGSLMVFPISIRIKFRVQSAYTRGNPAIDHGDDIFAQEHAPEIVSI
jgi:hypothetical protein